MYSREEIIQILKENSTALIAKKYSKRVLLEMHMTVYGIGPIDGYNTKRKIAEQLKWYLYAIVD